MTPRVFGYIVERKGFGDVSMWRGAYRMVPKHSSARVFSTRTEAQKVAAEYTNARVVPLISSDEHDEARAVMTDAIERLGALDQGESSNRRETDVARLLREYLERAR